ncbi:hypothetical protein [Burkholderia sp. 3C]
MSGNVGVDRALPGPPGGAFGFDEIVAAGARQRGNIGQDDAAVSRMDSITRQNPARG